MQFSSCVRTNLLSLVSPFPSIVHFGSSAVQPILLFLCIFHIQYKVLFSSIKYRHEKHFIGFNMPPKKQVANSGRGSGHGNIGTG
ncbi:hypothetical protein Ancab_012293 [Ancistrocladus abbreviatus]